MNIDFDSYYYLQYNRNNENKINKQLESQTLKYEKFNQNDYISIHKTNDLKEDSIISYFLGSIKNILGHNNKQQQVLWQSNNVKQQSYYFDNVKSIKLNNNINTPKFETREQAVSDAQRLGIKNIQDEVTKEMIQDVIEAIIDISNKTGDKIIIPNGISLNNDNSQMASIVCEPCNSQLGMLFLNKNLYDEKFLDSQLMKIFQYKDNLDVLSKAKPNNNTSITFHGIPRELDNDFSTLLSKYKMQKGNMTLKDKQTLYLSWYVFCSKCNNESSISLIKKINDVYKFHGYSLNMEDIEKKSEKEQKDFLNELLLQNNIKLSYGKFGIKNAIYHEFGHLQDTIKNQDILKHPKQYLDRFLRKLDITEMEKRNTKFVRVFNKDIKAEKPNFITNKEEQTVAGEVSEYAKQSVAEFIAETYSRVIEGKPISPRVIALYKKYNGPTLNI